MYLNEYKIIKNTSKIYFNGSVWNSINCGAFEIVGRIDKFRIDSRGYKAFESFLCRFDDGTIVIARDSNIRVGSVKNPNHPSVFGVGYLGVGEWKSKNNKKVTKEYRAWVDMLRRCYSDEFHKRNPSYSNCVVSERWHNFQNFCDDIQNLEGYGNWKNSPMFELDKDSLCDEKGIYPKIYSKDTCMFISDKQNKQTGLIYIAHRISDGYEEEFLSQIDFANKWRLNSNCIVECLSRRQKTHKGWTFKIKEY